MGARIEKFVNNLHEGLTTAETRLNNVKSSIGAAKADSKAAIEGKVADARAAVEKSKKDVNDVQAKLKSHLEAKKAETREAVADWKEKRHTDKLAKRADRAEEDAAWAIIIANDAIEQANLAAFEAIEARLDADEVAS